MKKFIPEFFDDYDTDSSSLNGDPHISLGNVSDGELDDRDPPEEDNSELSNHDDDEKEEEDSDFNNDDDLSELSNHDDDEKEEEDSDFNNDDDLSNEDSDSEEEPDVTIQDIFGRKPEENEKKHPPDLKIDSTAVDLCFHSDRSLLAIATMDGDCIVYNYSLEGCQEERRFTHHDKSCRQLCFSEDGQTLYTISKDQSFAVVDFETGTPKSHIKEAHEYPLYSFFPISEDVCATGDDDGFVKIWDLRRKTPVFEFRCGEQTVTSLISCDPSKYLAASVADGSITGINLSRRRVEAQSEMFDSEFTSLSLVRSNSKLCVGSGAGILYIFDWGSFGYNSDALSGHPDQIQCQLELTEHIILTGCEDGKIRAVHLYPHRFLGIVGRHKPFAVENLSVSHDGTYLASCSMDDVVHFWNIDYLYEFDQEINTKKKVSKQSLVQRKLKSSREKGPKTFFKDIPKKCDSDDEEAGPSTFVDEDSHLESK